MSENGKKDTENKVETENKVDTDNSVDNENKGENKGENKWFNFKDSKDLNNLYNNSVVSWMIAAFIALFVFNAFLSSFIAVSESSASVLTSDFIMDVADSEYLIVQENVTLKCVSYTPVFNKEGFKQYEVRFRDMRSDLNFTTMVLGAEVDMYHNIEVDAKYQATVSYLYVADAFTEMIKDLNDDEKNDRILALLKGDSEYANFGKVSDVSFMYGGVEGYNYEEAKADLDDYIDSLITPEIEKQMEKNKSEEEIDLENLTDGTVTANS